MRLFLQSVRFWMLFGCLGVLMLLLTACGGDSTGSSSTSSNTNASSSSSTSAGSDSTGASSAKTSVMTVMIKEQKGTNSKDVYSFDPATITVKKGDTITIQNASDELQDIDLGDAQKAGVDAAIPLNQSAQMTFKNAGTFTIKSEKGATITVTVQ